MLPLSNIWISQAARPPAGLVFFKRLLHSSQITPRSPSKSKILLVKKANDERVSAAFSAIIRHLREKYPNTHLLQDSAAPSSVAGIESLCKRQASNIDLVITLGGDGTILRAASLFSDGPVPPVLSFSLGTLGFLLPFHIDAFPRAIEDFFLGRSTVLKRMRLACKFLDSSGEQIGGEDACGHQVMNEVTLHRGRSPHLNIVDAFVDGQHLTEAVSDGLIISTPTGSTAYSLSSGGPIVHPSMRALLLTPICPRSLSFRPLVLPGLSSLRLRISEKSRAPAEVSMDGQEARILGPGESLQVEASPYPIPCINRPPPTEDQESGGGYDTAEQDGWVRDINRLLHFNASFKSSAGAHLS